MAFSIESWPRVDRTVVAPTIGPNVRPGPRFSEEVPEEVPESRQRRYQNSSSDGTRGGGDRAVAAHLEERLGWVVTDPARLFAAVESNVRSARERVGPLGFRVLQRVFARLARVVEQGSEYGPTDSRSTQPAWMLKSEHECWRWLSGDRILSDQSASMMSRIFGMCLDEHTFPNGRAAARRAAHAAPGSRVVMNASYVGSELVGAEGVVEAVEQRGRQAGGRWAEVAWTLAGGDVVREWLPTSVLGGRPAGAKSRERSCDRCRTKSRSCMHPGCQDMSLANDVPGNELSGSFDISFNGNSATLSASTMNLRTRPTVAKRPVEVPGTAAPRKRKSTGAAGEPKKRKAAPKKRKAAPKREAAPKKPKREAAPKKRKVAPVAPVAPKPGWSKFEVGGWKDKRTGLKELWAAGAGLKTEKDWEDFRAKNFLFFHKFTIEDLKKKYEEMKGL